MAVGNSVAYALWKLAQGFHVKSVQSDVDTLCLQQLAGFIDRCALSASITDEERTQI